MPRKPVSLWLWIVYRLDDLGVKIMQEVEYDCLIQLLETILKDIDISQKAYLRLRQLRDVMHECPDHAERSHRIDGLIDDLMLTASGQYSLYRPSMRRRY